MQKTEKEFLLGVFFLSLIINYLFFFFVPYKNNACFTPDSYQYNSLANNILKEGFIVDENNEPYFFRVPGYSLFIALVYKVFGNNFIFLLILQIFLASFIPVLVYFLSLILFKKKVLLARFVTIIFTFNLGYILYSTLLMSDIIFLLLFLIYLLIFLSSFDLYFCKQKKFKYYKFILAGFILGLLSYVRPIGYPILIVSLIFLFISNFVFYNKIKSCLSLFLSWFVVIFPLLIRNFLITNYFFLSTMQGIHFFNYIYIPLYAKNNCISYKIAKINSYKRIREKFSEEKNLKNISIRLCKYLEIKSLKIAKKNRLSFILISFKNFLKTTFSLNSSMILLIDANGDFTKYFNLNIFKRYFFPKLNNVFYIFIIYFELMVSFFIWLGIIIGFFNIKYWDCSFLNSFFKMLFFILLCIVTSFASGAARFRLQMEPFLIIISIYFWLDLLKKRGYSARF